MWSQLDEYRSITCITIGDATTASINTRSVAGLAMPPVDMQDITKRFDKAVSK